MAKCRFVVPNVTLINLSDQDWIRVKNQLTVGEERAAFQQIVGEVNPNGWRRPNMELIGLAEVAAYLVDWSFRDPQGNPVPVGIASIQQLDPESYKELETAVQTHVKKMEDERAASKNGSGRTSGVNGTETTSGSALASDGLTAI